MNKELLQYYIICDHFPKIYEKYSIKNNVFTKHTLYQ